jgi:hypothetical protein
MNQADDNIMAARKELDELLSAADENLESFVELAEDVGFQLDYSLQSLDEVENLLLFFEDKVEFEYIEADAWLYIGQVICKNLQARWSISNDLNNYREYYALPVVIGFSIYSDELCPMIEIENFLKNREKGYFRRVIQSLKDGSYRKK